MKVKNPASVGQGSALVTSHVTLGDPSQGSNTWGINKCPKFLPFKSTTYYLLVGYHINAKKVLQASQLL